MNKRKKLNQLYAGHKAAITRHYNQQLMRCLEKFSFASVAAIKAARTRRMNSLNRMFGW